MGGPFKVSSLADQAALSEALERVRGIVHEKGTALGAADVPGLDPLSRKDLASKAQALLAGRRARDRLFGGSDLFGEPAWDLMLDLFVAETAGKTVSVSSAAIACRVAPTTALRWIEKLVQIGLLEREPDHFDRRRHFISLSERAEELMRLAIMVY